MKFRINKLKISLTANEPMLATLEEVVPEDSQVQLVIDLNIPVTEATINLTAGDVIEVPEYKVQEWLGNSPVKITLED